MSAQPRRDVPFHCQQKRGLSVLTHCDRHQHRKWNSPRIGIFLCRYLHSLTQWHCVAENEFYSILFFNISIQFYSCTPSRPIPPLNRSDRENPPLDPTIATSCAQDRTGTEERDSFTMPPPRVHHCKSHTKVSTSWSGKGAAHVIRSP